MSARFQWLQAFETDVRVLAHFHQRDMAALNSTDISIARHFCEQPTVHRDCSICVHNIVNSQYRFCGWCHQDNTCRLMLDAETRCSESGDLPRSFVPPFVHPGYCAKPRHRGSLGCESNQDCISCLHDHNCVWCRSRSPPDPDDYQAFLAFFYSVAPGLAPFSPLIPEAPQSDALFDYTRFAFDFIRNATADGAAWEGFIEASRRKEAGQVKLEELAEVQTMRTLGHCTDRKSLYYMCGESGATADLRSCPSEQKYLVTPVKSVVPRLNLVLLIVVAAPGACVAIALLILQCILVLRERRRIAGWQVQIEEAAHQRHPPKSPKTNGKKKN